MLFPSTPHSFLPSSTHYYSMNSSLSQHPADQWAPTSDPTVTRNSSESANPPSPPSRSAGSTLRLPSLSSLQLPGLVRQHPSPSTTARTAPVYDRATYATPVASPPRKVSSHRTTVSGHRVPSRSFSIRDNYPPAPEHASAERDPKKRQCDCCGATASRHGPRGKNTLCSNCGLSFLRKVKTLTTKGATEEKLAEAASEFIETRSKYIEYKRSRDRTSSTSSASTSASAEGAVKTDDDAPAFPAEDFTSQPPSSEELRTDYTAPYWSYPPTSLQFATPLYPAEALPQIPFPSSYPADDYTLPRYSLPPIPHHQTRESLLPSQPSHRSDYPSPRQSTVSLGSISRSSSHSDLLYPHKSHGENDREWEMEELGLRRPDGARAEDKTLTPGGQHPGTAAGWYRFHHHHNS